NFVIHARNHAQLPGYMRLAAERWPRALVNVSFVAPSSDVVPRDRGLIPRYSDVLPSLFDALAEADRLGVRVVGFESMCGIPLCLVPAASRPRALRAIEAGYDRGEFQKPDACGGCSLDRYCYGLRRGYAELHGAEELRPVEG